MGNSLTALLTEATETSEAKLDKLKDTLAAQQLLVRKVETLFKNEYLLAQKALEADGIVCEWPSHELRSKVHLKREHKDLKDAIDKIGKTAKDIASDLIGGIAGEEGAKSLTGSVKSAFEDIQGSLEAVMGVFLGDEVGVECGTSSQRYVVDGLSIKMVYMQAYSLNLGASGLDGKQHVSVYVYLLNVAEINIYDSKTTAILTKLGNHHLGEFKQVLTEARRIVDQVKHLRDAQEAAAAHTSVAAEEAAAAHTSVAAASPASLAQES